MYIHPVRHISALNQMGFAFVAGWRCPLCNATSCDRVEVPRPKGATYKTDFFQCAGCTVLFRHPQRFSRLGLPVRRWAADVEPRTLREAHGSSSINQ
jgi:hypothetical protein